MRLQSTALDFAPNRAPTYCPEEFSARWVDVNLLAGCKGIELVANVRAHRAVLRRVRMTARLPRAAAAERSERGAGRKALRQSDCEILLS
jgi:hypothetical protein